MKNLNISLGMAVHNCNSSIQAVEAGGSPQVKGYPVLYKEFQVSQDCMVRL